MRKGSNAGFTLIEVPVALVIFSLMAVGFRVTSTSGQSKPDISPIRHWQQS